MKNKGFTLIELVMVMVILGIIGVLVMTPKTYLGGARDIAAAAKIRSDIRYAQGFALSTQNRTKIAFDASSESYSVYCEYTPGTWTLIANPLTKANFVVNLTSDYPGADITQESFGGSGNGLIFDKAGSPSAGGTITLGSGTLLTVVPNTGKVE